MLGKLRKKVEDTIDSIDTKTVKTMASDVAKEAVEGGVEVVKTGVFGIVNGILIKILLGVTFVVIILSAGCVGTSVAVDKLTSSDTEKVAQ